MTCGVNSAGADAKVESGIDSGSMEKRQSLLTPVNEREPRSDEIVERENVGLRRRRRVQTVRHGVQIAVYVLLFAHLYVYYGLGHREIGSLGLEEFFRSFLQEGVFNAGALLLSFTFVLTLLFGRAFCGWGCHFGALQEFSRAILMKLGIKLPTVDAPWVKVIPVVVLVCFFAWPTITAWSGGLPRFSVDLSHTSIWRVLPGWAVGTAVFIVNGFLLVLFFGSRGFCRLLCPWGALFKPFNLFSRHSVQLVGECTGCGTCTRNCEMGIDVRNYIATEGRVTAADCIKCQTCVSGCPHGVLAIRPQRGLITADMLTRHRATTRLTRREQLAVLFVSLATLGLVAGVGAIAPLLALAIGALTGLGLVTVVRHRRGAARIAAGARSWRYYLALAATSALIVATGVTGTYKGAKALAAHYVERGENTAALAPLRLASAIAPWNANLLSARAQINLADGNDERALRLASEATRADPQDAQGHTVLASVYERAGKSELAIREYATTLRLTPRDGALWARLCRAYSQAGRKEEAGACARDGIRAGVLKKKKRSLDSSRTN